MTSPIGSSILMHRPHPFFTLMAAGALVLAAMAWASPTSLAQDGEDITIGTAESDLGTYLTDPEGRTLYYFTRDVLPGRSRCSDDCAEAWPPLIVGSDQQLVAGEGVTGTLAAMRYGEDSMMAAYRGRPLYRFSGDEAAGDTNGQGVGGVWFVALEDGSLPPDPPALTLEAVTGEGDLGTYLTDDAGRTIYFFANDTRPGRSRCTGDCLEAWPPVTIRALTTVGAGEGVTGVISMIPDEGRSQVTYDGRPLYYFQGDENPGDTNGQGVGDVWFVAAVDGTIPAS